MKEYFYNRMAAAGNPRNSEGAFIRLKNNDILFIYSRYSGTSANDNAAADLAGLCSPDNGKTWQDLGIIIERGTADNIMSVSLLRLQTGRILMIYLEKRNAPHWDCIPVCRFSDDEGKTWSAMQYITGRKGYFVVNNDRIIQCASGRLLLPYALHAKQGNGFSPAGVAGLFYSDDNGISWHSSPVELAAPQEIKSGYQEPGVIELEQGKILLWSRTDAGYQFKAFSDDCGMSFSEPVPAEEFVSPCSPLSMKRKPDGKLLAVWNNHPPADKWCTRTPLVMAESADNGQTWGKPVVLGDDPDRGYCYTAILFLDDAMLLGYCFGRNEKDHCCLQDLQIRRIEW